MKEKVFGIDFGTTNTVIFEALDEQVRSIPINGLEIVPSIVRYGRNNIFELGAGTFDSIFSVKRFLGQEQVFNGHSVEEIYGDIFKFFHKELAHERDSILKTVLTVPAYFNERQRNIMKKSATDAGFKVLKILSEPTAAIFGHSLSKEGIYGVYDFGGGTFDFSIVEYRLGVFKVLKTGGDLALGGDDIDREIMSQIEGKLNISPNEDAFFKNKLSVQKVKEELSSCNDTQISVKYYKTTENFEVCTLERNEIIEIVRKYLNKTIEIAKDTIRDAGVSNFENLILVGGSSKFTFLPEMLSSTIKIPLDKIVTKNPDTIVAEGAARYADYIVNSKAKTLIDITPLTLGIELYGGFVDPIIKRNSQIPIEKTEVYTKDSPDQQHIKINIIQGEREIADKCTSLGTIILRNLPYGKPRIYVRFKIDHDGILSVKAWAEDTTIEENIVINPIHKLDIKRVEAILTQASDGVDDIKKRLIYEAQTKAKQLIEYVDKFLANNPDAIDADTLQKISQLKEEIAKSYEDFESLRHNSDLLEKIMHKFAEKSIRDTILQSLNLS